jgi:hypothetical protein
MWFGAAFIPVVASQVLRLHQHDAGGWLFWDYAGRLAGLAVLLLWLRVSHSAVRNCECRGYKSRCGSLASSSPITTSTGLGRPAAICFHQQFLEAIRCPRAGCIDSTLCSGLASTPTPRKSFFDDALGTCSSLTSAMECLWYCSRRCCSALIIGGRVPEIS